MPNNGNEMIQTKEELANPEKVSDFNIIRIRELDRFFI